MKKYFLTFVLIFVSASAFAQNDTVKTKELKGISIVSSYRVKSDNGSLVTKVKVVVRPYSWSTSERTYIGFFKGYYTRYNSTSIYLKLFKIKKDGTSSKQQYSNYEVPSIDYIISIEEVTE